MIGEATRETPAQPESRSFAALAELIQGGRPLIYICSPEEARTRDLIGQAARRLFSSELPVFSWSATAGLTGPGEAGDSARQLNARAVLEHIASHPTPALFQLKDFHDFVDQPEIRRRLRDLYELCRDRDKFIIITSPIRSVPEELARQMALMELLSPDLEEMLEFVRNEMTRLAGLRFDVDIRNETMFAIARAMQGLTLDEAHHAVKRALAVRKKLDGSVLPQLLEEKKLIVNKSGLVQYVADGTQIEHVGGLEFLKQWLLERRKLFIQRDSLTAEIVPKGLLVMGVSGCGKSLSVKAIASCFGLPLYRIDMIEVFSGRHGNPDAAFVEACRTVETMAPAVVWFDEIEMGLTNQSGDEATNLGRIFAYFLTWMQEKTRGLFVAATANRIDLLPAEMIRKGRFDEVFFIDLPSEEERMEILRIHVQRRGYNPDELQLHRLKRITQGWTGAEIEQCVVSAITTVRLEDKTLSFESLHAAALNVIPLSKTMREQVEHIRSWAYDRAVRASPREGGR